MNAAKLIAVGGILRRRASAVMTVKTPALRNHFKQAEGVNSEISRGRFIQAAEINRLSSGSLEE